MDAAQLRKYLRDAEAKLDILLSPEVQQARDWVGSYMAVLALPKREELQKQLPDVANMTAPQIEQAVRGFLKAQQQHARQGAAEAAKRKADVAQGRGRKCSLRGCQKCATTTATEGQGRSRGRAGQGVPQGLDGKCPLANHTTVRVVPPPRLVPRGLAPLKRPGYRGRQQIYVKWRRDTSSLT